MSNQEIEKKFKDALKAKNERAYELYIKYGDKVLMPQGSESWAYETALRESYKEVKNFEELLQLPTPPEGSGKSPADVDARAALFEIFNKFFGTDTGKVLKKYRHELKLYFIHLARLKAQYVENGDLVLYREKGHSVWKLRHGGAFGEHPYYIYPAQLTDKNVRLFSALHKNSEGHIRLSVFADFTEFSFLTEYEQKGENGKWSPWRRLQKTENVAGWDLPLEGERVRQGDLMLSATSFIKIEDFFKKTVNSRYPQPDISLTFYDRVKFKIKGGVTKTFMLSAPYYKVPASKDKVRFSHPDHLDVTVLRPNGLFEDWYIQVEQFPGATDYNPDENAD